MIYGGEIFADVTVKDVTMQPHGILNVADGAMGPFPDLIGVRLLNEGGLKDGSDDVHEAMVDDAVSERCCGDHPHFGLVDEEGPIGTRRVCFRNQIFLDLQKIMLKVLDKVEHTGFVSFACYCPAESQIHVLKGNKLHPEMIESFHVDIYWIFSARHFGSAWHVLAVTASPSNHVRPTRAAATSLV